MNKCLLKKIQCEIGLISVFYLALHIGIRKCLKKQIMPFIIKKIQLVLICISVKFSLYLQAGGKHKAFLGIRTGLVNGLSTGDLGSNSLGFSLVGVSSSSFSLSESSRFASTIIVFLSFNGVFGLSSNLTLFGALKKEN